MKDKICFAVESSLIDLINQQVPNFNRSSPVYLERNVNNGIQLYLIPSYYPAIDAEDGSLILEPSTINLISWNMDLSNPSWLKGSNVIVFPDELPSVTNSYVADKIVFAPGQGNTQLLKKSFSLLPGTDYYFSAVILLAEGLQATTADVIRLVGGVVGEPSLAFTSLNNYTNRYRLIEIPFKTSGALPQETGYSDIMLKNIENVSSSSIKIIVESNNSVRENQLVGANITFSGNLNDFYEVISNSAANTNKQVTINFSPNALVNKGISTSTIATFRYASSVAVDLEIYVESTLSLAMSGMQLEQHDFRTSIIFQNANFNLRSSSSLEFNSSPFAGLKTCGVFIELKEWRGDGILFDAGNFQAKILSKKLVVSANTVIISLEQELPKQAKIFIQISQQDNSICVYINKILQGKASLYGFLGGRNKTMSLSSVGVRIYYRFAATDKLLLDGNPEIGSAAIGEVGELFNLPVIIDAETITSTAPLIDLGIIKVPSKKSPDASSAIKSLNETNHSVTVVSGALFTVGKNVVVYRGQQLILRTNIVSITSNTIVLASITGINLEDILFNGEASLSGVASVRFPFTPIDQQKILAIDSNTKRLTVTSSLSYKVGRAFVQTTTYQDVAEVIIQEQNNANGYIFIDDCTGISVGDIISQPMNELLIDPPNYFYGLIRPINGLTVSEPHRNGIMIYNSNPFDVECNPYIRVFY